MPDVVPETQRGTASGYFGVANVVGLLAGTIGSGWILAHAGRTTALLSICGLLVLTMLATVLFIPDRAPRTAGQFKSVGEAITTTFAGPLRYPSFLWLLASR